MLDAIVRHAMSNVTLLQNSPDGKFHATSFPPAYMPFHKPSFTWSCISL